ncbi:MAG: nucleoside 2-deoxyribosyltransferase [Chloroflexi bacterium]|nr:nucleoside 2-deoxyribosyltransferase [Chloroflexota bacterium]
MTKQAYIGIKFYEDNRNKNEILALSDWLNRAGYSAVCIARDVEQWGTIRLTPQELMQITFAEIDKADLVVMEMSVKGVGLGIEAGYAYAQGKPIVVLIREGRELSETMAGIATKVIAYQHEINLPLALPTGQKN